MPVFGFLCQETLENSGGEELSRCSSDWRNPKNHCPTGRRVAKWCRGFHLDRTLPGFLSRNFAKVRVVNFDMRHIGEVSDDIAAMIGGN